MITINNSGLRGREILVIDVDDRARLHLADLLRHCGALVTTAADGLEAVPYAITGRYDAIVAELRTPDADGIELARTIRRLGLRTRLVLVADGGTCDDFVEAMESGADAFVRKPFKADQILDVLQSALARAV